MKSRIIDNKSVRLKEALEAEARSKGINKSQDIARYVSSRLSTLNQGIDVSPVDYEAPEDWHNKS